MTLDPLAAGRRTFARYEAASPSNLDRRTPSRPVVWTVRQTTPIDLARTGAFVSLVAGSLRATGYAVHGIDDSVPFFVLWYGGTIALCILADWELEPKLLRCEPSRPPY
jgi:hypothetical protein